MGTILSRNRMYKRCTRGRNCLITDLRTEIVFFSHSSINHDNIIVHFENAKREKSAIRFNRFRFPLWKIVKKKKKTKEKREKKNDQRRHDSIKKKEKKRGKKEKKSVERANKTSAHCRPFRVFIGPRNLNASHTRINSSSQCVSSSWNSTGSS